ncbi:MAG: hypothetical protein QOE64_130 [Frankiales bacterium]|jgi:acetyl esterase/lipase|nr:hypothetical protein [Frankiales bacterium]
MPLIVSLMNAMARARGMERITVSSTAAQLDNSNSEVIDVAESAPIPRRIAAVRSERKVQFATVTRSNGSAKPLFMDVLTPPGPGPFPAIVYVSGGGFLVAVRRAAARQRAYLAAAGFVVASIDYRVVPDGATWREGVADVRSAVRFLRSQAERFSIAPDRVGVWGESAGAYLSSMTAATAKTFEDSGEHLEQLGAVQAAASFFGAADLSSLAAGFDAASIAAAARKDSAFAKYVAGDSAGRSVNDMPEEVLQASPKSHASPDGPAFLLFHGEDDRIISPLQTQHLHDDLRTLGVASTRYVVRNAGHGIMGDNPKLWLTTGVMDLTAAFFKQHLIEHAGTV